METLLAIGIVMTVLFGTLQFGVLGFLQTSGDGAAFVAAHVYSQSPALGTAHAASAANAVFAKVPANTIVLNPQGSAVTVTVGSTADGLRVPGAPATVALQSSASERVPSAPGATPGVFSVSGTLSNFRDASGVANAARALVLAQTLGTGHGVNGRFAEWLCRDGVYSGISFPAVRPTGAAAGPNSSWDPMSHASPLAPIYAWDSGTTCA